MNHEEISVSTLGSNSTFSEQKNENNTKIMSTLVKLVYKDKKSIKQASKYLNINYNMAKKIIKNFRKNQLTFSDELNSVVEEIVDNESMKKNTLLTHFKYYEMILSKLNEEIKFNNNMIMVGLQLTRMCPKV